MQSSTRNQYTCESHYNESNEVHLYKFENTTVMKEAGFFIESSLAVKYPKQAGIRYIGRTIQVTIKYDSTSHIAQIKPLVDKTLAQKGYIEKQ